MQGYVHIYTGDGKGKTTAALGLALRAAGAGLRVYIGQFIKNAPYSELEALKKLRDAITLEQFGRGCFLVGRPEQADINAAQNGLATLRQALCGAGYDLVIADEINVALAMGLISEKDVLDLIAARPPALELVLTGRGASPAILAQADLITEMRALRHYYDHGVQARKGIES